MPRDERQRAADGVAWEPSASASEVILRLSERWEGRGREIATLVGLLAPGQPAANVFVYGGQSAGKTSVVRDVLRETGVRHVYLSCRQYMKPAQLLQAAASGLQGHMRAKESGYEPMGSSRDFQLPSFIKMLPDVCPQGGEPTYIVLDDARHLAQQDLLAPLLRLRELSGGTANIGVVLVSHVGWESYVWDTRAEREPLPVLFRPYSDDTVMKILLKCRLDFSVSSDVYVSFLRSCVAPFLRCSRNLHTLNNVSTQLYTTFTAPVREGSLTMADSAALHGVMRPHLKVALENFQTGVGISAKTSDCSGGRGTTGGLDFELPYMSKFLLMAAYVASRNRASTDRRLFDMSGGRGKRRRVTAKASDKQAEAAKEAMLAGPGSFDQERLLAIFWIILNTEEDDEPCDATNAQSSEIFMQIASLVTLRLLIQTSTDCGLEKHRYKCNISDDLAQRVAKNIKLDLSKYLVYT